MNRFILRLCATVLTATLAVPAAAQDFDPSAECRDLWKGNPKDDMLYIGGLWAEGVKAAITNEMPVMDLERIVETGTAIFESCGPTTPFVNAVLDWAEREKPTLQPNMDPHGFLDLFFQPDADYLELSMSMKPTEDDLRRLFAPEAAQHVAAYVDDLYTQVAEVGGLRPEGKGGRFKIDYVSTTGTERTEALAKSGNLHAYDVLARDYLIDIPVYHFEFIRQGEANGISYTGLYNIDGRYIWMPKVWKALP